MAEGGDDLARGADTTSRPQDREIEPRRTVLGEAIAASADWTNRADCIEGPVNQRLAAGALLSAVGFLDVPVPVIIDASVGFNPPNSGEKTGIGEVGRVVRAGSSRDGAIPSVSKVDRIPRHCYHIVAARLQRSTKYPRVHPEDLTDFTKRSTLLLPRARPH